MKKELYRKPWDYLALSANASHWIGSGFECTKQQNMLTVVELGLLRRL